MTAFVCVCVPGLIARKRLARGAFPTLTAMELPAFPLIKRGVAYGLLSLLVGGGSVILALSLGKYNELNWLVGLTGKLAFGGLVATIVTPAGLRALFRQAEKVL